MLISVQRLLRDMLQTGMDTSSEATGLFDSFYFYFILQVQTYFFLNIF